MGFLEIAKYRFSSRRYQDRLIEEAKLENILEAARIAPSAANYQPLKIIVLSDNREDMQQIYKREWFRTAPVILVVCGDHRQSWKRADGKDHCDIDVAIAADHITLEAADQGLATCWICNFDKDLCSKILGLPDHIEPIVILPLGYPADKKDINRHDYERKALMEIVHFGKYNNMQ